MKTFGYKVDDELSFELPHLNHAHQLFQQVDSNRDYLRRWLGWVDDTNSSSDTGQFINFVLTSYAKGNVFPGFMRYRGEFCGVHGISISQKNNTGEIGYWIGENFQGNGIATRATEAMTAIGFELLGLDRLLIRSGENNAPSWKIPERLDWAYEGTWREAIKVGNRRLDLRCYSRLASEHEATGLSGQRFIGRVDDEITLEPVHRDMAAPMFAIVDSNREHLGRWLDFVPKTTTMEHANGFASACMNDYAAGRALRCAVRFRGDVVGAVGLETINRRVGTAEIGYWLSHAAEGNGIMTRAVDALTNYAFEVEELHRVEARMEPDNTRSESVVKRCAYQLEGTARSAGRVGDRQCDVLVYARIR